MAHVSEFKKKVVKGLTDSISKACIVVAINVENLPAPQLQRIRAQLRDNVDIFMTKKRLMRIALKDAEKSKKGIMELEKYLEGMPAMIFTKENPFKLFKLLAKNKSSAPAKPGQKAPRDIVIPKGPTSFAPGPIISELGSIGLKTGVENGKVAVKEDSTVAKKGDEINQKLADVLVKLGIEPMEVGLDLVAVYEDGIIYDKDVLDVDEEEFMNNISQAARQSFNLAMFIEYPNKDTIEHLLGKASRAAKALGLSQEIIDGGIIEELIGKASSEMTSLKNTANIKTADKKEAPKEEPKPAPKPEEKKEETKPSHPDKKEEATKEQIKNLEKKEEKALEEEKKIIEEEKRLEKEEEKNADAPVEKEVKEAVKQEEEKKLEQERIDKEKKVEKIEDKKEELSGVDKLIKQTKDHAQGKKGPSAADLINDVPQSKEGKKEDVPKATDLAAEKQKEEQKNTEELVKKLQKKGTLRKQ